MKFTMEIDIKEPNFYRLQLDDYSVIFLILEAGDNIEIAINGEDIRNPKISGSKQSELAYTSLESSRIR